MELSTWKEMIQDEMDDNNDSFDNLAHSTLTEAEMREKFDCGFGGSEGQPFTVWTKNFVYFPVVYDGAEWVGSVPRNPCNVKTEHQGRQ